MMHDSHPSQKSQIWMVRIDGCRQRDVVRVRQNTTCYPLAEFINRFVQAFHLVKAQVSSSVRFTIVGHRLSTQVVTQVEDVEAQSPVPGATILDAQ